MKNTLRLGLLSITALLSACNVGNPAQPNQTQQNQSSQNVNLQSSKEPFEMKSNKQVLGYTQQYTSYIETGESIIIATPNFYGNKQLTVDSTMPIQVNTQLKDDNVVADSSSSYAYVLDPSKNTISAYNIDKNTGQFSLLTNTPHTYFDPTMILTDIKRVSVESVDYIYVTAANGKPGIYGLVVNKDGTLRPQEAYYTNFNPTTLTIDNYDSAVYVIDESTSSIYEYKIDPATASLSFIESITAESNSPILPQMAFINRADGSNVAYVASSNYIYSYSIDHASGKLSLVSKAATIYKYLPSNIVTIPGGPAVELGLAYAASPTSASNYFVEYMSENGSLYFDKSQSFLPNQQLVNMKLDPSGELFYVYTNESQMEIYDYALDYSIHQIESLSTTNVALSGLFIDNISVTYNGILVNITNSSSLGPMDEWYPSFGGFGGDPEEISTYQVNTNHNFLLNTINSSGEVSYVVGLNGGPSPVADGPLICIDANNSNYYVAINNSIKLSAIESVTIDYISFDEATNSLSCTCTGDLCMDIPL